MEPSWHVLGPEPAPFRPGTGRVFCRMGGRPPPPTTHGLVSCPRVGNAGGELIRKKQRQFIDESRHTTRAQSSSGLGKYEGESLFALCDRLDRTRDNNQIVAPDGSLIMPTREYQTESIVAHYCPSCCSLCTRTRVKANRNKPHDRAASRS